MGETRYTIVQVLADDRILGDVGCFEVFDNVEGRCIQGERFSREIDAEAWIFAHDKDAKDDLDLETELEAEGRELRSQQRRRELRGMQIVMNALIGKVVCSHCDREYHGAKHQTVGGVTYPPSPIHNIKITRYIGYDTPKLTVDLTCRNCCHTGLYKFPGNPLIDAGMVGEIPW